MSKYNGLPLNVALDKMLKELGIKPKDVCALSEVSGSRLSQFRSGKGGDITVRSLDALLDAAESLHPRAKAVFAKHIGGITQDIKQMTLAEKGELLMELGRSVQTGISIDSKSSKTA